MVIPGAGIATGVELLLDTALAERKWSMPLTAWVGKAGWGVGSECNRLSNVTWREILTCDGSAMVGTWLETAATGALLLTPA